MRSPTLLLIAMGGIGALLLFRQRTPSLGEDPIVSGEGPYPVEVPEDFEEVIGSPEVNEDAVADRLKQGTENIRRATIQAIIAQSPIDIGLIICSFIPGVQLVAAVVALIRASIGFYYSRRLKHNIANAMDNIKNYAQLRADQGRDYAAAIIQAELEKGRQDARAILSEAHTPDGLAGLSLGAIAKRLTNPLQDAWTRVVTKPILKPLDRAIIKPVMKPVMRVTNAVVTPIVRQVTTNIVAEAGHAVASASGAVGFKEGEKAGRYTEKVGDKGNEWVEKKGDWVERMGSEGIVALSHRTGARMKTIYVATIQAAKDYYSYLYGKYNYDRAMEKLDELVEQMVQEIDTIHRNLIAWADAMPTQGKIREWSKRDALRKALAESGHTKAEIDATVPSLPETKSTAPLLIGGGLAATAAVFALGNS